jgi:large subunit ribosomal protein L31
MKKDIHPESYRTVVFKDFSVDHAFLGKSCAATKEISSESHPFYTGKMKFVDTAGRIEKFRKKYGKKD